MNRPARPLDGELLYLFVLGPGTGETILLHSAPDGWIVIDSFTNDGRPAAEEILDYYGGNVAAIVLTHPHQDHCLGIIELLDRFPGARIGCVHPRETAGVGLPADPVALLKERARPTYDRIWQEWSLDDRRKWRTFREQSIPVCGGRLVSLHPSAPVNREHWNARRLNDLSSPMRFLWHDVCVLLGADATENAWPDIAAAYPDLANHQVMKVPHHGSAQALHGSYGTGDADRQWIITPFAGKRLPRPADGEGLSKVLTYVKAAGLTSLPYAHDGETGQPYATTRSGIRDDLRPKRTGSASSDPATRATRYIAMAYDKTGRLVNRWFGEGTVEVGE